MNVACSREVHTYFQSEHRNVNDNSGDEDVIEVIIIKYCNGFSQRVSRQRLCKHGDYATVENTWQQ
jgi:hypothetical protein